MKQKNNIDLGDAIREHLIKEFDRRDDGGALTASCLYAIDKVNDGHGQVQITDKDGAPKWRPGTTDEPWTAEKFVHDLELSKFLREN